MEASDVAFFSARKVLLEKDNRAQCAFLEISTTLLSILMNLTATTSDTDVAPPS